MLKRRKYNGVVADGKKEDYEHLGSNYSAPVWPSLHDLRKHLASEEDIIPEFEITDDKNGPKEYNFETHFGNNSIIFISTTEHHLRQVILDKFYDNDVYFMKKHFIFAV